jgi:hypothetical protein
MDYGPWTPPRGLIIAEFIQTILMQQLLTLFLNYWSAFTEPADAMEGI